MGLSSTLIYTSELNSLFRYLCSSATWHNIHMLKTNLLEITRNESIVIAFTERLFLSATEYPESQLNKRLTFYYLIMHIDYKVPLEPSQNTLAP